MRWLANTKVEKRRPRTGDLRKAVKIAWFPVKVDGASGPHGWDAQWVWLERYVRIDMYTLTIFGSHFWWNAYKRYPIEQRDLAGI